MNDPNQKPQDEDGDFDFVAGDDDGEVDEEMMNAIDEAGMSADGEEYLRNAMEKDD